jgi:rod shape-determining protein MreC
MLYLMLSVVLMAMDQRGQYIPRIRTTLETGLEPVYHLIGFPSRVIATLRLRALLDATGGRSFEFRFAEMVQVNLDPFSHQVMIDRGSQDGVFVGQAVLDGAGVMGQVHDVHIHMSSVLLISDPDHALPVQIARTGLRTVAYGTGETARLLLPNVPLQADVRTGDLLVTSGLGDRFPPGFPVAEIEVINRDTGETFAEVYARPLAALDRGREVLLVIQKIEEPESPPAEVDPEP